MALPYRGFNLASVYRYGIVTCIHCDDLSLEGMHVHLDKIVDGAHAQLKNDF